MKTGCTHRQVISAIGDMTFWAMSMTQGESTPHLVRIRPISVC